MSDQESQQPPRSPYQPPGDDQIIVWIEDEGKPFVLAIYDRIDEPSAETQRDTYRGFVERVGPVAAEVAIRLYRMELADH